MAARCIGARIRCRAIRCIASSLRTISGLRQRRAIHAQHGFDLSEVQFDVPATEIEFFQFLGRIKLEIEQRGGQNDFFGAKTRNGNFKSLSAGESFWQLVILFFAPEGQTLGWFVPNDYPIILSESATAAKVLLPGPDGAA